MKVTLENADTHVIYKKKFDSYSKGKEVSEFLKIHTQLLRQGYEVITLEKEKNEEETPF